MVLLQLMKAVTAANAGSIGTHKPLQQRSCQASSAHCVLPSCVLLALQLLHAINLSAVTDLRAQPTLLAVAAHFPAKDRGTVRLIDNAVLNESMA